MKKLLSSLLALSFMLTLLSSCQTQETKPDTTDKKPPESINLVNNTSDIEITENTDKSSLDNQAVRKLFEGVLANKESVYGYTVGAMPIGYHKNFATGCVIDNDNEYAYIDFDQDGIDELLIRSGYDYFIVRFVGTRVVKPSFEAYEFSARGTYTFFANGEFCDSYDYNSRHKITKFNGVDEHLYTQDLETISIEYTDEHPADMTPITWTPIEFEDVYNGLRPVG